MNVKNKTGVKNQMNGNMFVSVGGGQVYHLSDFRIDLNCASITKAKKQRNYIAFLKPASLAFDSNRYYYFDKDEGANGSWRFKNDVKDSTGKVIYQKDSVAPDCEIPNNSAFMTYFGNSDDNASLVFSGEVQAGSDGKILIGAPAGVQYLMVANPSCKEISLKDMQIVGDLGTTAKKQRNYIAFLKTDTAAFDKSRYYYCDGTTWKYLNDVQGVCSKGQVVANPEDIKIAPGEAVMFRSYISNSGVSDGASIQFPSAF